MIYYCLDKCRNTNINLSYSHIIFSENFSRLTACRSYVTSEFRDKFKNGCSFFFLIEMDKIQTVPLDYLAIDFLF